MRDIKVNHLFKLQFVHCKFSFSQTLHSGSGMNSASRHIHRCRGVLSLESYFSCPFQFHNLKAFSILRKCVCFICCILSLFRLLNISRKQELTFIDINFFGQKEDKEVATFAALRKSD